MANAMILNFIRNAETAEKAETLAGISIDAVIKVWGENKISYGQAMRSIAEYRKAANERFDIEPITLTII